MTSVPSCWHPSLGLHVKWHLCHLVGIHHRVYMSLVSATHVKWHLCHLVGIHHGVYMSLVSATPKWHLCHLVGIHHGVYMSCLLGQMAVHSHHSPIFVIEKRKLRPVLPSKHEAFTRWPNIETALGECHVFSGYCQGI